MISLNFKLMSEKDKINSIITKALENFSTRSDMPSETTFRKEFHLYFFEMLK